MSLSYIWIYFVSSSGYSNYKTSLNDYSNRMRAVANIYGLKLLKENHWFVIGGVGDELTSVIGVQDPDFDNHPKFMETRLVQPHNSILNLMLKMGIVPCLMYLFLLSVLLKSVVTYDNYEYFVPYLLNTCFMHSLLDGAFLILWIFLLAITSNNMISGYKINETTK